MLGEPRPETLAETMSERLSFWSSGSSSNEEATLWLEAASDTASRLSLVLPNQTRSFNLSGIHTIKEQS